MTGGQRSEREAYHSPLSNPRVQEYTFMVRCLVTWANILLP